MAKVVERSQGVALTAVFREKDQGVPRWGAGEEEKGDMTPHLFRAAPEGNINFTFLAMT